MRGNGGRRYSGTVAMNLRGGTKGVCRNISTPTFKSIMELNKSVQEVW